MNTPDEKWLPFLKIALGFLIILMQGALATAIALGHVNKETSYGLDYILGSISSLTGVFGLWAFTANEKKDGV